MQKPPTGGFLCGENSRYSDTISAKGMRAGALATFKKGEIDMPDYNPKDFSPSFGGQIDSAGNIKNLADAITGTGANTKLKVDTGPPQVIFMQGTAAAIWTIDHNLGRYPQVTTIGSDGILMTGEVTWPTLNQVVITFTPASAGKAVLT
jgi:hypothetical protein